MVGRNGVDVGISPLAAERAGYGARSTEQVMITARLCVDQELRFGGYLIVELIQLRIM